MYSIDEIEGNLISSEFTNFQINKRKLNYRKGKRNI